MHICTSTRNVIFHEMHSITQCLNEWISVKWISMILILDYTIHHRWIGETYVSFANTLQSGFHTSRLASYVNNAFCEHVMTVTRRCIFTFGKIIFFRHYHWCFKRIRECVRKWRQQGNWGLSRCVRVFPVYGVRAWKTHYFFRVLMVMRDLFMTSLPHRHDAPLQLLLIRCASGVVLRHTSGSCLLNGLVDYIDLFMKMCSFKIYSTSQKFPFLPLFKSVFQIVCLDVKCFTCKRWSLASSSGLGCHWLY